MKKAPPHRSNGATRIPSAGLRGETDASRMRARVAHDLYYIENWSLWLDIWILARTVMSPKSYRNAY